MFFNNITARVSNLIGNSYTYDMEKIMVSEKDTDLIITNLNIDSGYPFCTGIAIDYTAFMTYLLGEETTPLGPQFLNIFKSLYKWLENATTIYIRLATAEHEAGVYTVPCRTVEIDFCGVISGAVGKGAACATFTVVGGDVAEQLTKFCRLYSFKNTIIDQFPGLADKQHWDPIDTTVLTIVTSHLTMDNIESASIRMESTDNMQLLNISTDKGGLMFMRSERSQITNDVPSEFTEAIGVIPELVDKLSCIEAADVSFNFEYYNSFIYNTPKIVSFNYQEKHFYQLVWIPSEGKKHG